jgi:hypothetical protein
LIVGIDAVLVTAIIVGRKRLFTTRVGRLGAGSLLLWGFTTLAHRLLAASLGTPLAEVLSVDLWMTAMLIGALTLALRQRFWIAAAISACGAFGTAFQPEHAVAIYSTTSLVMTGLLLYAGVQLVKER